jgi:hypothetical protein
MILLQTIMESLQVLLELKLLLHRSKRLEPLSKVGTNFFFIIINIDIRVSLRVPQLIL